MASLGQKLFIALFPEISREILVLRAMRPVKLSPKSVFYGYYASFLPFLTECLFVWDANLGLDVNPVEDRERAVDEETLRRNNQVFRTFRSEEYR